MTGSKAAPRRTTPIEDFALLSDRRTAALVAHGTVEWWCVPEFDRPAAFARLLGTDEHGLWTVAPIDGVDTHRAYQSCSMILDTHWATPTGAATSTDFLATSKEPFADADVSLVRRIACTKGSIEVDVELVMRFDYGRVVPWVRRLETPDGTVLHALAGPDSLTLQGPTLHADGFRHRGRFTLESGESLTWVLTWRPSHLKPPPAMDPDRALAQTLAEWHGWKLGTTVPECYREAAERSLVVLRALTFRRTGGIVAAPTTSLPEELGGERNWDYRFTWLRDSALTITALASHGHHKAARLWSDWLLRAVAGDPADLQIMYGISGERRLPEQILDHLPGYASSAPVRIGNGAYTQYQADAVGAVMMALSCLRDVGVGDAFSWSLQIGLLDFAEHHMDRPDRGIWEVRGDPQLFTHSRVMLWAAFDRGVHAVEQHGLQGPRERWRDLRDELRAEIMDRGVHDGGFVQAYGTEKTDAALLQIPHTGFVAFDAPVMLETLRRIEAELVDAAGFVRRYVPDGHDGVSGSEGSFLMCSFWLVEQYARSGRGPDAHALMDRLLAVRNDLGLLSEEYDTERGRMLGNFPQAFSHLALVRAARALREPGSAHLDLVDQTGLAKHT